MSADIDNLLAEGRDAADGKRQPLPTAKAEKISMTLGPANPGGPQVVKPTTSGEKGPTLDPTVSSSDEEGEIRGDSTQPTSIDQPLKSVESRQDTTTEAQEKLDRQMETSSVYGTLKQGKAKPTHISTTKGKANAATSKEIRVSPKTNDGSQVKPLSPKATRHHPPATRGRNAVYDSYKPSRDGRREPDMEIGEFLLPPQRAFCHIQIHSMLHRSELGGPPLGYHVAMKRKDRLTL